MGVKARSQQSARVVGAVVVVFALMSLGWMLWTAQALLRADLLSAGARHQMQRWLEFEEPWSATQWLEVHRALSNAITVTPENPVLHESLGALLLLRAQRNWGVAEVRRALLVDAKRHYERSLALRPVSGRTWAGLAWTRMALGESSEDVFAAAERALHYSPNDMGVQRLVVQLVAQQCAAAPEELMVWYRTREADPVRRQRLLMPIPPSC